jgi:hypothetical protein
MPVGRRLTPAKKARMDHFLQTTNLPPAVIAERLGISRSCVMKRAKVLGLSAKQHSAIFGETEWDTLKDSNA